jgi:hypothetical protein
MREAEVLKMVQPVFDDPGNAALRRVVGDALLERQHPWGEFIALQFAPPKKGDKTLRRRMDELLKKGSVEQFLGAIAKVVVTMPSARNLLFEGGFLTEVRLDKRLVPRPHWDAAARAPHWATVRKAEFSVLTTPQWWVRTWAANPAATRSLEQVSVTGVRLQREPSGAFCLTQLIGRTVYASHLEALAAGLASNGRRITLRSRLPAPRRREAEAALAEVGVTAEVSTHF